MFSAVIRRMIFFWLFIINVQCVAFSYCCVMQHRYDSILKKRDFNIMWWISQRFDNGTRDASFSIGLQGIKKDDYAMVVEQIHKTFDQVIE